MKRYIGSKEVNATPMTRQEYNDLRGWTLPADEDGNDDGYLVEYLNGGVANHPSYYGYISWSPKDVFERAYRTAGNLTFGDAVELMKSGEVMTRTGWNGRRKNKKPMSVELITPDPVRSDWINKPFFVMIHADESVGVWTPVTNDVLANDWTIVKN
jgi:hypothetical protein